MTIQIKNARIITPFQLIGDGEVVFSENGKFEYVGEFRNDGFAYDLCIDAENKFLSPGLIDIHVHGGKGITFGLSNLKQSLIDYSAWVVKTGVVGFLLSIAAPDATNLIKMIEAYIPILEDETPGAKALGLHLEGPFLNVEKKGAFNSKWLRKPNMDEVDAVLKAGKGWIKQVTIAPELEFVEEITEKFKKSGVVVALGHSNTDYETASKALKRNFTHVTHTFNAQSSFNHRAPGVMGAILTSDDITAELIADRVHVHPGAMRLLYRCLGRDRIILITDAMAGAGLEDGFYDLVGEKVFVENGNAKLENGTIAGSTAGLLDCVANVKEDLNLSLHEAIQMASYNPAKFLKLKDKSGEVSVGLPANFIIFDEEYTVHNAFLDGKRIL